MERWPGMPGSGSPPQYSVEIHGSGQTVFEGWFGANVRGKRRGRVSRKEVARLVVVMMENGFFSMPDLVPTTTDIPTTSISLKIGTVKKSVLDKDGLSKHLLEIERLIDSAGETNRWLSSAVERASMPSRPRRHYRDCKTDLE